LIVARLLAPSDYGLMALVATCTGTIYLLVEMGLGAAILQFPNLRQSELNACFWLMVAAGLACYSVLFAAAPFLAGWFDAPEFNPLLRVGALGLILVAFSVVPDALLRKEFDLDKVCRADIVGTVAGLPVTIGLAYWGAGAWALVIGQLVQSSVRLTALWSTVRWWPGFDMASGRLRQILGYSGSTLGNRVCWAVYQQADVLVIGKIAGEVAVGTFSLAKQLILTPVTKVTGLVNELTTPFMARMQEDLPRMGDSFLRSVRFVTWLTVPLFLSLMIAAHDLIVAALTTKWEPAVPVFRVLCVYGIVYSVSVLYTPVLMATYRANLLFKYMLLQLVVMPCAFIFATQRWGVVGVAWVWALVYPMGVAWLTVVVLRTLRIPWSVYAGQFRSALVAGLFVVVMNLMIQTMVSGTHAGAMYLRLAAAMLTGCAAYVGSVLVASDGLRDEVPRILGWILRQNREPVGSNG
jgi:O-antigen/teichoic acid export membrane protein